MEKVHRLEDTERLHIVRLIADELAQHPSVAFAYAFGSFAEARPFHDIDIGVYRNAAAPSPGLEENLAQNLSAALRIPVDVRVVNDAPVSFLFHVLRGELLFSRDDELLSTVIENTTRCYLDIAPVLRNSAREAFAG